MLRDAKEQCDYLICGLQIDPSLDRTEKNPPVQTIVERYTQLNAVKYVNEIIPYQTEKDFTGKDICKRRSIQLYFNKREHRFSSSDLRNRVKSC